MASTIWKDPGDHYWMPSVQQKECGYIFLLYTAADFLNRYVNQCLGS